MYTGGAAPSNERSGIISFIYSWFLVGAPHMEYNSPLCSSSFLTYNQPLPGTITDNDAEGVALTVADPLFPRYEQAAAFVEALNGSLVAIAALCRNMTTNLPIVHPIIAPLRQMRRYAPLRTTWRLSRLRYSTHHLHHPHPPPPNLPPPLSPGEQSNPYNASNTTLVFEESEYPPIDWNKPPITHFSAKPRLIVRGPNGEPLPGRYCTVEEVSSSFLEFWDVLALTVTVDKCGPSDANGVIEIEGA